MGVLSGLLDEIRQAKEGLLELRDLQNQMNQEGLKEMSKSAAEVKAALTEIRGDVDEIDGDVQELLDKITALGDAPTATEMAELLTQAKDLKARTAATALKVPEPPTP